MDFGSLARGGFLQHSDIDTAAGQALNAGDASASFAAADRLLALLRSDRNVSRLVRQNPVFHSCGPLQFGKAGARGMLNSIERHVAALRSRQDMDGLCDLFFESDLGNAGLFWVLRERSSSACVAAGCGGTKAHAFHAEACIAVMGSDPQNALMHLSAIESGGNTATPVRMREYYAGMNDRLAKYAALTGESGGPDAGTGGPRM